jgi:formylmethanofuran dehydrogenase subunit E
MNSFSISPVGHVENRFDEPVSHHTLKGCQSIIVIEENYSEALLNIDRCEFLDVVFYFHKAENAGLSGKTHSGEVRGVFASRSPARPNSIGITTVKLQKREGNRLFVTGLDAINNTPVIDIKSCDTSLLEKEHEVHASIIQSNPRIAIYNLINEKDHETLMLLAGRLHGHFCPGLAMGVMAATYAMNELNADSDGMEELLAITETNNCFSDGIQYVTGCSFGNNSLIFKDLGKTAFTLTRRDGKGIRVCSGQESQDAIIKQFPEFNQYYRQVVVEQNHEPGLVSKYKKAALDRAFGTLKMDFDSLFKAEKKQVSIPDYAHIDNSVICTGCGESVMQSRTREQSGLFYCIECQKTNYRMLDGNGIH